MSMWDDVYNEECEHCREETSDVEAACGVRTQSATQLCPEAALSVAALPVFPLGSSSR